MKKKIQLKDFEELQQKVNKVNNYLQKNIDKVQLILGSTSITPKHDDKFDYDKSFCLDTITFIGPFKDVKFFFKDIVRERDNSDKLGRELTISIAYNKKNIEEFFGVKKESANILEELLQHGKGFLTNEFYGISYYFIHKHLVLYEEDYGGKTITDSTSGKFKYVHTHIMKIFSIQTIINNILIDRYINISIKL